LDREICLPVQEREELIAHGVYDQREYTRFRRCGDFLWAVRCHVHFVTQRSEDRLSFDIQREIAVRSATPSIPACATSNAS